LPGRPDNNTNCLRIADPNSNKEHPDHEAAFEWVKRVRDPCAGLRPKGE
jgi:hypothetical protein